MRIAATLMIAPALVTGALRGNIDALPSGWAAETSVDGSAYYVNKKTLETTTTRPTEPVSGGDKNEWTTVHYGKFVDAPADTSTDNPTDTLNKDSPGWGTDLSRVMAPWEHKYMDKFGPLCKQMAEEKDACDTCPRPQFKYPAADGLGIAPLQLDRTRSGLPTTNKRCGECGPKCQKRVDVLKKAFDSWSSSATVEPGNKHTTCPGAAAFHPLVSPHVKDGIWSVIGFGATQHACFATTFDSNEEMDNTCYSHQGPGSRLPYFCPKAEDLIIDSCGDMVTARVFCDDCKDFAGHEYPQRYSWLLQLEDNEEAEHGFYIVKNNAILDTETTLIDQVSVLKPYVWDNGKYRCNLIESIDEYAAKGAAPPTPLTNRVDFRTEANAFGTCSSCPTCNNKMAYLEKAWGAYTANGAAADREPIMRLLKDGAYSADGKGFEWFVSGAGPTLAGCFAHTYTSKWQLQDPSFGMWARLDAMTRPEETKTPIKPVIMLGSCGDKAQVYVTQTRVGRSGQHYTHAWAFTLYLEDDASTKEGFRIATVIAGHDTEMLMNMAEREQLSDTYTCPKIGNWSEAVTHTIMQP